jgi:hypothetical protein
VQLGSILKLGEKGATVLVAQRHRLVGGVYCATNCRAWQPRYECCCCNSPSASFLEYISQRSGCKKFAFNYSTTALGSILIVLKVGTDTPWADGVRDVQMIKVGGFDNIAQKLKELGKLPESISRVLLS